MAHRLEGKSILIGASANKIQRLWQSDHILSSLPRSALLPRRRDATAAGKCEGRICARNWLNLAPGVIRYTSTWAECLTSVSAPVAAARDLQSSPCNRQPPASNRPSRPAPV